MEYRFFLCFVVSFVILSFSAGVSFVSGQESVDVQDKINDIVHYAEEYEVGNINYLQLNVYGHGVGADLNLMLGGGIGEEWGRIPVENIENAFGPPTDYTNWAWVENKNMDKRFDEDMPWWERIIFDGRKIQIMFHASPQMIEGENGEMFKYYSVDLNVKFKKEYKFDIESILNDINSLIVDYNLTRTRKVGKTLAEKMVEYERLLRSYIQDNIEHCMEIVGGFFNPEEKWPEQKIVIWEFSLYGGDDFDVRAHFDMCEECEWHHLYMGFWVEGRGPMFIFESPELHFGKLEHQIDEEYYWTLSIDELNQELEKTVFEIRDDAEKFDRTRSEDFPKKFFFNNFKIEQINRILDGKYNDFHEFDEGIGRRIESGELQGPGECKSLMECRIYCEKRENMEECRMFTYNLRVESIEKIFSEYNIKKTPVKNVAWERRLFENIETRQDSWCMHVNDFQCNDDEGCVDGECVPALGGNETCNNGEDDDGDNVVDCQDPDCWQERHCGKICEDICNREAGCWQTTHGMCHGVCQECWDCGGGEECWELCDRECNPCHNNQEVRNACDDCWICEDDAYGGCYIPCKSCGVCDTERRVKVREIFDRAAAGEIQTPGGCMSEKDCNDYCMRLEGEEQGQCWDTLNVIGLHSEELDCSQECKECSVCNYDLGNLNCNDNQNFDRGNGYCVCDERWYDCDGDWQNGCETDRPCWSGPCYDECETCDPCWEGRDCGGDMDRCMGACMAGTSPECEACLMVDCLDEDCEVYCEEVCPAATAECANSCNEGIRACKGICDYVCLDCYLCRNPDMPTYICDGVEQLEPCEPEFMCNGVKQKKPCKIYICDGKEYTKPCDEINITCGENQVLIENTCACKDGFKDCDNDGICESTKSCGFEICDDSKDNNNDNLIDCQDLKCDRQVCGLEEGKELLCIGKSCIAPEEEIPPEEPEPICGDHICEGNESKESCPEDCVSCMTYDPPECPDGKIVWKGKDRFGCLLPPICVVTEKVCEIDDDCPKPRCGISECIEGECKVKELTTDCDEGCKEGKTKKRKCKDGSEITTAVCSANQWIETGYDCPEVQCEEGETDTKKCEDESEIVIKQCINSEWIETGEICKEKEITCEEHCETLTHPACAGHLEFSGTYPDCVCRWICEGDEDEEEECPPLPISCWCPDETLCPQLTDENGCGYWGDCPEEEIPEEDEEPEEEEEIAPEVEEEEPEFQGGCVLMGDCGGPQDVCSNGNCVTLPIPIEEEPEEEIPEIEEPELPPEGEGEIPEEEETPEVSEPTPEPEITEPVAEPAPEVTEPAPEPEITGDLVSQLIGWITGMQIGEMPCNAECRPCEDCNRKIDDVIRKIGGGEIEGPGGCTNRMECERYCWDGGCEDFEAQHGFKFNCWDGVCRECEICRYDAGELQCNQNQYFDREMGHCNCMEGFYECDGDWENGCESQQMCGGCESREDCAEDRCAPWGNVIQQFDCIKGEEWIHEMGVVRFQGSCRFFPTKRMEGWVQFDMWGDPFEELRPIREEIRIELGKEWCEWELENKIKGRMEIQNSLKEDFLKWFFEEYVPSSPSEWEKHIGGIFDLYWDIVNTNRKTADLLLCLGEDKLPEEYEPIDVSYNTDFGSVRIWEVETTTDFFGKRVKILSPYMQIWVFPTKEFIKLEFKQSMETGKMPGPEEKDDLSPAEIQKLKDVKGVMDVVNEMSEKYGGEAKFLLISKDGDETVFKVFIRMNPDIVFEIKPVPIDFNEDVDVTINIEFDFLYDMIVMGEKNMRGGHIERPPWDQGMNIAEGFSNAINGISMWWMIQTGIASGKITSSPPESLYDALRIMEYVMGPPGGKERGGPGEKPEK